MEINLSARQKEILEGVCQEYIKQAFPISSDYLKEKYRLPYSSATIRNEFSELERKNYLSQPYISAGRIPTDKGYRFFVDQILEEEILEDFLNSRARDIEELFAQLERIGDLLRATREITRTLSSLLSGLVLTHFPSQEIFWKEGWEILIKEPEFRNIHFLKKFLQGIEELERNIDKLDWERGKIKIYIGRENPLHKKEMSVVISQTLFPGGIEGRVAILGPKRMDFKKNISLINSLIKIAQEYD